MSAYFACDAFAIAPAPYYTPSLPALTPDTPSKSLPSSTPPDHYSNNDQTLIDDVEQQNHHEQDVPQKDFDDLVKWLTAHEKEFPQYPVSDVDDPSSNQYQSSNDQSQIQVPTQQPILDQMQYENHHQRYNQQNEIMFDGNNVPEPVIRLDRSLSLPGFSTMPEPSYPTFALSAPPTYAPLPADPSTYADQFAVSAGETSRGPFYGLPPPSFWATVPLIPNTPSQSSTGSAAPEAAPTKRKAKRSRKVAVPLTNTATLDMSRHGGLPGLQAKLNRGFRVRADAPRKQNAK